MLKGIHNSDIQNNQLAQSSGVDKTGLFAKSNPFKQYEAGFLVDQTDISSNALQMYQKELDVKKYTELALSDQNDASHNSIVASQIENGTIQFDDADIVDSLFSNSKLIEDLFG